MANIKIAQLTNQISLSDTDLIIVESATSTNKMTVGNLKNGIGIESKADKAWGDTMNATLQNGWSGAISFAKNDLGIVFVTGVYLNTGTVANNTTICTLPTGFRPSPGVSVFSMVGKGNVSPYDTEFGVTLNADGNIMIQNPLAGKLPANTNTALGFSMIYKAG